MFMPERSLGIDVDDSDLPLYLSSHGCSWMSRSSTARGLSSPPHRTHAGCGLRMYKNSALHSLGMWTFVSSADYHEIGVRRALAILVRGRVTSRELSTTPALYGLTHDIFLAMHLCFNPSCLSHVFVMFDSRPPNEVQKQDAFARFKPESSTSDKFEDQDVCTQDRQSQCHFENLPPASKTTKRR